MLLYFVILVLLDPSLATLRNPDPHLCPSMKYTDYNANRIPARITGIYCLKHRIVGKACNNSSKVDFLTAISFAITAVKIAEHCKWC